MHFVTSIPGFLDVLVLCIGTKLIGPSTERDRLSRPLADRGSSGSSKTQNPDGEHLEPQHSVG